MKTVVAIVVRDDEIISVGTNEHKGPCGREGYPTGEGYELCEWCQYDNHAEANAVRDKDVKGATVYLFGHYYACEECKKACKEAGAAKITICEF